MFGEWEDCLQSELASWQNELDDLESRQVDKRAIYNSARSKALRLLSREAQDAGLIPDGSEIDVQHGAQYSSETVTITDDWYDLANLDHIVPVTGRKPMTLRFPNGNSASIDTWRKMYVSIAEWLFDEKLLTTESIPASVRNLLSPSGETSKGRFFSDKLTNGFYLSSDSPSKTMVANTRRIIEAAGISSQQFAVQLR